MKNINTVKKSDMPALSALSVNYEAAKAAQELYKNTCAQFDEQLRAVIKDADADHPILNRDLARAAGMSPLHMANIIGARHSLGVNTTSVRVTRRFVEIDEDGAVIPGEPVREVVSDLVGYYGKRTPGRW